MSNKRILIIYGYERIVPPFMQTIIRFAVRRFDEIKYITPPMLPNYYKTIDYDNVQVITWNKIDRLKQYITGILSIFRPQLWSEAMKRKMSKSVIAYLGKYFFCSDGFIALSEKTIKKAIKRNDNVYILATWMSVEAFTAARIKEKYPMVKAFVLAHSGEVISARNPFMHQSFHEYIFQHVNKVYFISKKVLEDYIKDMSDIQLRARFNKKIATLYLGSINNTNSLSQSSKSNAITLLSCSRIDANKRLDKIITALAKWTGCHINWIHIGTGVLEEEIKSKANSTLSSNPNIDVKFVGRLENSDVIKYFIDNPVDLFINVSKSEGLPISIMEAMSFGVPCIATDVGGTSEIVNCDNGYLLGVNFSDEDLLGVLNAFVKLTESEKQKLRKNAYNTWETKFNAVRNSEELFRDWDN